MSRRGGRRPRATTVLLLIGFGIGLALASHAVGDGFSPGVWAGMVVGWSVGLAFVYYLRRRP